jgi:arginine exporter protein ArgO
MHALNDLFTTDVGLMSIGGIVFMLGMGVFFIRYFMRHIQEDTERAQQAQRAQRAK